MSENDKQADDGKLACDICKKEIPQSEGLTDEANDYVAHFCGLDCLDNWKEKTETQEQ